MLMPIQINMVDGKVQAVSMWHPINGKWVLVTQIIGENHKFYTDGVEVGIPSAQQSVQRTATPHEHLQAKFDYICVGCGERVNRRR